MSVFFHRIEEDGLQLKVARREKNLKKDKESQYDDTDHIGF